VVNWLVGEQNVVTVLLPRTAGQEQEIRKQWAKYFDAGKLIVPSQAVDGLSLMWHSDLVISGGGTMNREAAAMGVPVYSIFRGKIGAVDHYLADQGRLVLLDSVDDVRTKIKAVHREKLGARADGIASSTLKAIVREIISLVEFNTVASQARPN